ncbi:MAG: hypothetical protein SOZ34_08515 [Clostridia bacterium]|nr:hypothetical protein [Clostridia bacterium]
MLKGSVDIKEKYIDLMELVVNVYTKEHIKKYTDTVVKNGISEHGFPRLTANLGILISHGRKTELKDDFILMMDLCCNEYQNSFFKNGTAVGNDFSIKEIVFCLLEVEKAGICDKSITDRWRRELAKLEPLSTYTAIASIPPKHINNWAAFGAASEQLRKYACIGDKSDFIENQIASQLLSFDENGMYRDPNEPILYDLVTRLQLAIALYFGFDGISKNVLENFLMKSEDITLYMQSVTGEIPFGGRSNQFLHNESCYAALCEYYASALKKCGNIKKAGMFKQAATIAVDNIYSWLKEGCMHHVKNYYDTDSKYGCEEYAYFDKYMVTIASWSYMAYVMADDDIPETACPAKNDNYICETSHWFHKVFCKYNDYFVEFDTAADEHYDSSGIGRVHKAGAPSTICLSVPFTKNPNYTLDISNSSPFSICGGIETDKGFVYALDNQTEYKLIEKKTTEMYVQAKFECKSDYGVLFYETCTVSDAGVEITVEGNGALEILFPILEFDGKQNTEISSCEKCVEVTYKGHRCRYTTDNNIIEKNAVYANRNGHYKAAAVCGKDRISLKIDIE